MLTKEQIMSADDKSYAEVEVPEWGGTVRVRTMTGKERDELEGAITKAQNKGALMKNFRATVCCLCICDDSGKRLFLEPEIRDLGERNGAALDRVFTEAITLNGIGDTEVKELVGNSSAAPSGDSGSN